MHTRIQFIGNLGADPEMRFLPDGRAVTNMRVANNRSYKDNNDEWQTETTWYRVAIFGKKAERANDRLSVGSHVLVEGRMKPDEYGNPPSWQDNDGNPRASYEVIAYMVLPLDKSGKEDGYVTGEKEVPEDDIPF